ncbi:MAG TPA: hypothetical protein VFS76_05350 [Pyrinomonadaceae bacterium]|nr:hypothetical protein [Pyrinomonadaceae bacterium]
MSEFIAATDVSGGVVHAEHHTKRVLIGDAESVKRRLIPALERLDYRVLSEQPLQAKRSGTRKVIGKIFNASIKLTVALRHSTANSTLAVFDYEVMSSTMYQGDHHTIEREVDAIVALASQRPVSSVCVACGANNTGDSRFCRVCGVPNTGGEPAELEVLRLNAEARTGHRAIITGVSLVFGILLLALPLILFGNPKGIKAGWAILVLGEIAGWLTLFYGMLVLHRALNPKKPRHQLPSGAPQMMPANDPVALPPRSARASVTENSTELLFDQRQKREAIPINRGGDDTTVIG